MKFTKNHASLPSHLLLADVFKNQVRPFSRCSAQSFFVPTRVGSSEFVIFLWTRHPLTRLISAVQFDHSAHRTITPHGSRIASHLCCSIHLSILPHSENTQYMTHVSKLSRSTSCATKNHSGVKSCRVAETRAKQLPQVMSPKNLRLDGEARSRPGVTVAGGPRGVSKGVGGDPRCIMEFDCTMILPRLLGRPR